MSLIGAKKIVTGKYALFKNFFCSMGNSLHYIRIFLLHGKFILNYYYCCLQVLDESTCVEEQCYNFQAILKLRLYIALTWACW